MNNLTWFNKGNDLSREIRETVPPENTLLIWHLGQCGFVLKTVSHTIGMDLILMELFNEKGEPKRMFPPPFPPETDLGLDFLLVSHDHSDHYNRESVKGILKANSKAKLIISKAIEKESKENLIAARQNETIHIDSNNSIIVLEVPHEEYIYKDGTSISMGFILKLGTFSLFFAGDTIVDEKLIEKLNKHMPYDILFLPINGRDEKRHREGIIGNMREREALSLSGILNHPTLIPMHYNLFSYNNYDIEVFKKIAETEKPEVPMIITELGKMYRYKKND